MTSAVIYWVFFHAVLLYQYSKCYYLSVKNNLPVGSKIFDFSDDFESGIKYSILYDHQKTYSDFPFILDEDIGVIRYMPLNHELFSSKVLKNFDFNVTVSHNHYILTMPFQIKFISENENSFFNDNFVNTKGTPKEFSPEHHVTVFASDFGGNLFYAALHSHQCPTVLLPKTFCFCKIFNYTESFSSTQFKLKQFILNCYSKEVLFPNQKIVFEIKLKQQDHNTWNRKSKIVLRKTRSLQVPLHFIHPNYTCHIMENKPKNTFVCRIQAYDQNGNVPQRIKYGLEAVENKLSLKLFKIDNVGGVYTNAVLDYEHMSRHAFRVTANLDPTHQIHTLLNIMILDSNDNKPVFSLPNFYEIRITESQKLNVPILNINAHDKDEGSNGEITYQILKIIPQSLKSCFAVMPNGDFIVNGSLDHEKQNQYNVTVIAKDQGKPQQSSSLVLRVEVTDINDNYPQFSKSVYIVNVSEDTQVGKVVETVHAHDQDALENGQVTYALIHGNRMNKFLINHTTGELKVRNRLDYEEGDKQYILSIRASDGGRPPKSNTTTIQVNVIDVNDNSPQFYYPSYNFNVLESAQVNSFVGRVQAYDRDDGENSRITYSIIQKSSTARRMFNVNRGTGTITVARTLDYETMKKYKFNVRATDNGRESERFTQTEVNVNVQDVNDNAPQFTLARYSARIPEDTPVGSDVKQIQAIDPDKQTALEISYSISGGDPRKKFSIVSREGSGIIKLNKRLDYKKQSNYRLVVTATDGFHINTTTVFISIMDTNSYQPIFDQSTYSANVKEDSAIGTTVIQVHANDDDAGENARITYCLTSGTEYFAINETTGCIKTRKVLDYEKNPIISLNVKAQDNGIPQKYGYTQVDVNVLDANDNAPRFDYPQYDGSVSEDSALDTTVLQIHATDLDSGSNSRIFYTFTNGDDGNGHFIIDRYSGIIRTAQMLDRETLSQYNLVAYAVDEGSPPRSTSVVIVVDVLDVDDNAPQFVNITNNMLIFHVPEDVKVRSKVAQIQAIDPDEQPNSIKYDLDNDPLIQREWYLDPYSGILKNLKKLDYEQKKKYEFLVTASSSNLIKEAKVIILVDDRNDNEPQLKNFEIIFNNYRSLTKRSFPYGVIGRVPAFDPDASDHLVYRFISGNNGDLLKLNQSTGDLKLNPSLDSNRQFTAAMLVQVSDGLHSTKATCLLKVVGINDVMLQHSITVRVLHMNAYTFLAPSIVDRFSGGLADILNTSSRNIFIFNVQNDTNVILNVSFSARNRFNQFFSSKYLQDQVYLNRQTLVNLTGKYVLPFDDNICLREPCLNYKRCTSVLTFNSSAPFISSPTMIFRPIHPVYKLKCECPIGFTNDETCADEIDLCYSNPCSMGATCVAREGGYSCLCPSRHTGKNCEINLDDAQCSDHPGVCKNGGTCSDEGSLLTCDCTALGSLNGDDLSATCELVSRHFSPGDFLMLHGITNQWHFTLSLSFSTVDENGLLLYNGRLNHQHDFIALEVIEGQVHLNFSTGNTWTSANPYVTGGVNDGKWHTVEIKYYNEPSTLSLPHGVLNRLGPSSTKIVTLTVDPASCDDVIASHWDGVKGNYSCSVKVKQVNSKKSLDLTSPLLLGGVPQLPEDYQVHSRSFSGCLGNLLINGRKIDLAKFVANNGSSPGCAPMRSQCSAQKCLGHGSCSSNWNNFKCDCKYGFTGRRCEHQNDFLIQLKGRSCLSYSTKLIPVFQLPWQQRLSFRTFDTSAVLIHVTFDQRELLRATLKIVSGYVTYDVNVVGTQRTVRVGDVRVDDGQWHDVLIYWKSVRHTALITLTLDEEYKSNLQLSSNLRQMRVNSFYIGGRKTGASRTCSSFTGCVQNVQVTSRERVHRFRVSSLQSTDRSSYSVGCSGDGCKKNPCPINSVCVEEWTRYRCQCRKGYIGDSCVSACTLSLCENGATCRLDTTSPHGYSCDCAPGFQGPTCARRVTESCPSGWFGSTICAPCRCPPELNFDQNCDGQTGACSCKPNHFLNSTTRSCSPCDCYLIGSVNQQCQDDTGQCQCKDTVIGKQCNRCASQNAEVTNSGCRVLYEKKCPKSYYDGIEWERTRFHDLSLHKCPRGSVGIAHRLCEGEEELWAEPDFSNCTSDAFADLSKQIEKVTSSKEVMAEKSIPLSFSVVDLTHSHSPVYENDVISTCRMIETLLDYESKLSGFDLAASVERSYTSNLVEATSTLLDNDTVPYWHMMEGRRPSGTPPASLIRSWESYMRTMLVNLELIRCNMSRSRSPHMDVMMTVLSRDQAKQKGYSYTHQSDGSSLVKVTFKKELFRKQPSSHNISQTGNPSVGLIVYKNMDRIIPLTFADDRTLRKPANPSVNSAVISLQLHLDSSQSSHQLADPVEIQFRLLNPRAIEPQCMSWNFSARSSGVQSGGWSKTGCNTIQRDGFVTCVCFHLTTFAVITDEEAIRLASASLVAVYIGNTIAVLLLVATIVVTVVLQVSSVRMTIIQNLASSLLLVNLVYIAVNQPIRNIYFCMTVAICFHFVLLSTFSWLLADGLHLYRKVTEPRDVDRGKARFYFIVGWIIPFIITALSVGLDARGYGNSSFCWISMNNLLIWSVLGPVILCSFGFIVLLLMSIHAFLSSKIDDVKRKMLTYEMRSSFAIAISIMLGSLFATLAVNLHSLPYFYLYTLLSLVQAILIFVLHCFRNEEVGVACKRYKRRRARRADLNTTRQHLLQQSFGMTPASSSGAMLRVNCSTSESISFKRSPVPGFESDSDASVSGDSSSDSSLSIGSTSDDEQVEINTYRNIQSTKPGYQPKPPRATEKRGNGRLPSNGDLRRGELSVKKKLVVRMNSASESDGSNETAV